MKQITFFATVLLISFSYNINAQIEQITKDASLVIEGTVLFKKSYWNDSRTRILTKNCVLITSVFKGVPSDSIVSVITNGGRIDDYLQFQTHSTELRTGQVGYFFLKDRNHNDEFWLVNDSNGFCIQSNVSAP